MKTALRTSLILAILAIVVGLSAWGQTRTVTLAWQDGLNPVNTTYNVYRSNTSCTDPAADFQKINQSAVAAKAYSDSVSPGSYCYRVTAFLAGLPESGPSNTADAPAGPFPPSGLSITVQVTVNLQGIGTATPTVQAMSARPELPGPMVAQREVRVR